MTIPADVAAAIDAEAAELGWSRAELVSALPLLCRLGEVRRALRILAGLG